MANTRTISLDDKWTVNRGRIMLNGTQAIARVMLAQSWIDRRAGLATAGFISGYRGSPLGNVDSTLWSIGKRLGDADVHFQPGINEDLAATAVAGTQQIDQIPDPKYDGVFAAWYGKGPGVDRSGDAFKHGHFAGAHAKGGVVLFYGDDHAGKSSTVAYQSEQAIAANLIPSFYPADVGEILHYGLLAFALSRHSGLWVGLKCVNEVVEQTATVDVAFDDFAPELPKTPPPPPEGYHAGLRLLNPLRSEQVVIENRLPLVIPFVRANGIDRAVFRAGNARLAIATAGKSFGDVRQALTLLGLDERGAAELGISLYKVGCVWPLDGERLADFARGHETMLVVEEKKSFIETQIALELVNDRSAPRLIGKRDEDGKPLLSSVLPLAPVDIAAVIAERLARLGIEVEGMCGSVNARAAVRPGSNAQALRRTPFFCSGCPHNRSTRLPDGSVSMTGIGCHTMVHYNAPARALAPVQMGGEGANWMGLAPFTNTPHIFQNLGDGTYYHSGLLAIRSAVASGVNITYKILYNDAVAMTGGQPVDGPISVAEIAQQVRHEGVGRIVILSDNPDAHRGNRALPADVAIRHRDQLDAVQRELRAEKGCTVLIYEQTCAAEKRRRRKRGKFPDPAKRMFIAENVCEGCGDCSVQSTCVSIMPKETAFGIKRQIDQSSCNKDYTCAEGFCPSFVTVKGAEPRRPKGVDIDDSLFANLADPPVAQGACNMMVAGIGGTGVITVGALIGMAAHIDGRAASLFDMTGLAQKNGAVYSHIRVADAPSDIHAQRLGRGDADVLLAFDMVAALAPEAADTVAEGRTCAIANSALVPTAAFQFDRDLLPEPEVLTGRLGAIVGRDRMTSVNATALALGLTGDTIAANLMVVGMAAQMGILPVSVDALEQAITLNGVAVKLNRNAFRLGRLFVAEPDRVIALMHEPPVTPYVPETLDDIVEHWAGHLTAYQDSGLAMRYRARVARVRAAEEGVHAGSDALTRAFAVNYPRLLAPKDEYEVARLLRDPALHSRISSDFEDGARLSFNLAPPFLPGRTANGRPRKREFPAWIAMPVLRAIAACKGLRGTAFDIFGYAAERREERKLCAGYEELTDRVLSRLDAAKLQEAATLLNEIASVRGYGPVKQEAMDAYAARIAVMEERFFAIQGAAPNVEKESATR